MIVRAEAEFFADDVEAISLSVCKAIRIVLENRRRVHHGLVEPKTKEFITKVVVCGYVTARSIARVAIEPMEKILQRSGQARGSLVHVFHDAAILEQHANEVDEIIGSPGSAHIGLAGADRAAERHVAVEGWVEYVDRRLNRCRRILAVARDLTVLADGDSADLEAPHLLEHEVSCELIEDRRFGRAGEMARVGQANCFHSFFRGSSWPCPDGHIQERA